MGAPFLVRASVLVSVSSGFAQWLALEARHGMVSVAVHICLIDDRSKQMEEEQDAGQRWLSLVVPGGLEIQMNDVC